MGSQKNLWVENMKAFSGKTFVIENDTIKAFEKVKTTAHFEQIMEALN